MTPQRLAAPFDGDGNSAFAAGVCGIAGNASRRSGAMVRREKMPTADEPQPA